MVDLDLLADIPEFKIEDSPELQRFKENIGIIERLWRLTDEKAPNYFYLRRDKDGNLKEKSVSMLDLYERFLIINEGIENFDLYFSYMVRVRRNKSLSSKGDKKEMLRQSSLYLEVQEVINKIRSTPEFLLLLDKISITGNNTNFLPFGQHWDIFYTSPEHDKDKNLIEMLMSCSKMKKVSDKEEYLKHIFSLNINTAV